MSRRPNRSAVACVTTIAFASWAGAGASAITPDGATTRVSASCVSLMLAVPSRAPSVRKERAEPAYSGTTSISPSASAGCTSSLGPAFSTWSAG